MKWVLYSEHRVCFTAFITWKLTSAIYRNITCATTRFTFPIGFLVLKRLLVKYMTLWVFNHYLPITKWHDNLILHLLFHKTTVVFLKFPWKLFCIDEIPTNMSNIALNTMNKWWNHKRRSFSFPPFAKSRVLCRWRCERRCSLSSFCSAFLPSVAFYHRMAFQIKLPFQQRALSKIALW